jgi:EAL domain-containing protein (putative c-di-GMP-specific phosphodiesterase class I)
MLQQYVFILDIDEPQQFEATFGQEVAERAWQDIQRATFSAIDNLLNRYQFTQLFQCQAIGQCHGFFESKKQGALLDIDEQKPVIIGNARKLIREIFIEQLGLATGRKLRFSIAVTALPEGASTDALDEAVFDTLKSKALREVKALQLNDINEDISPYAAINRSQFEQILISKSIQTHFQSIVSLPSGEVVGYEALTRGPEGSDVQRADKLFNSAAHFGLTDQLELLCIERALEWVPHISQGLWVSLNIGPSLLMSSPFEQLLNQENIQPILPRLVFELTEHLPLEHAEQIKARVLSLKQRGIRLSLDDTGCGFFDLDTVEQLRPSMVKLCITVIKRIQGLDQVAEEIKQTRLRIAELDGITLGEGVETQEQRDVLEYCGVSLAQGYLFDRPAEAASLFS